MRSRDIALAAMLALAPLGAQAADLVVWWDRGYYPEEDEALAELISAFEQKTGKDVELVQHISWEMPDKVKAAIEAGHPPDFLFGIDVDWSIVPWAYEDRLADLTDSLGSLKGLLDADLLERSTLLNGRTGQRALYALPMGRVTTHVHVWRSLLEEAGFTLADVPKEWEAFWSFWCDEVQPAVRRAMGRDDIWGIGLAMSVDAGDTISRFNTFLYSYEVFWASPEGRIVVDDPAVRTKLVEALADYTSSYHRGCTPPGALEWNSSGNNEAFLAQQVVMTTNSTLSIPNALKRERPQDYYENTATIDWPNNVYGRPPAIVGGVVRAAVFNNKRNVGVAKDFVRFLIEDGWLAHYLDFANERVLPPMSKLLEQPFWLDPSDPHRMASAIQTLTRPRGYFEDIALAANWQLSKVVLEKVWPNAVHRVAAEGISPEQAVDEAIARIKQILSE